MFENIIQEGGSRHFLRYESTLKNQHLLSSKWEKVCVQLKIPAVYVVDFENGTSRVLVEILEGLRLTPIAHLQIHETLHRYKTWGGSAAREVRFHGPAEQVERAVKEILKICSEDRNEERQRRALEEIPRPFEGMARCVDNTGMEDYLAIDEVAYIREIPNQPDHCIVLKTGMPPLVSILMWKFELPFDYESF